MPGSRMEGEESVRKTRTVWTKTRCGQSGEKGLSGAENGDLWGQSGGKTGLQIEDQGGFSPKAQEFHEDSRFLTGD